MAVDEYAEDLFLRYQLFGANDLQNDEELVMEKLRQKETQIKGQKETPLSKYRGFNKYFSG
ncbi:hypothetical protein [Desulfosporosinus sp. SB140]|uniref:hypothetical protein n=1 Tax=Desulfosporosinus paludis TaxID=3115649 RepID=UPI00388D3098